MIFIISNQTLIAFSASASKNIEYIVFYCICTIFKFFTLVFVNDTLYDQNYQKALDEFLEKNPNWGEGVYATDAWWEDPKFLKQVEEAKASYKRSGAVEEEEEEEEEVKDERTLEVEKIATDWAKREFFSQSMAGTVDEELEEEEFIETVWERAMFEADLKFREMNGEEPDVEAEMLDFKTQQERKQQTMLKMAKQELQDVLDEEDLGGVDENVDTD